FVGREKECQVLRLAVGHLPLQLVVLGDQLGDLLVGRLRRLGRLFVLGARLLQREDKAVVRALPFGQLGVQRVDPLVSRRLLGGRLLLQRVDLVSKRLFLLRELGLCCLRRARIGLRGTQLLCRVTQRGPQAFGLGVGGGRGAERRGEQG